MSTSGLSAKKHKRMPGKTRTARVVDSKTCKSLPMLVVPRQSSLDGREGGNKQAKSQHKLSASLLLV